MNFRIGDQVLSYEVIDVLGAGGMGEVYKVRNRISDRIEAMKVLLADLQAHPELADRFLREIKVQARLTHPNIAGLHTAFEFEGKLVMILEMIEGVTVSQRLKGCRLSVGEAIDHTTQALDALDYAHRLGVTHRDVKPANMMITPGGTLKLMDFGIAKAATEKTLTRTGGLVGTLHYMSPEQIRGGTPLDGRTDLYSLGIVLYEMLTGRRPFDGPSEFSIMKAHLEEPPVPPESLDPSVPTSLSNVILRALAKKPADRFQTAAKFREELMAQAPLKISRKEAKPRPERPPPLGSTPAEERKGFPKGFDASQVAPSLGKQEPKDNLDDDFERAFGRSPAAVPPVKPSSPGAPAAERYVPQARPPKRKDAEVSAFRAPTAATSKDAPLRRSRAGLYAGLAVSLILAVAVGFQLPQWLSKDTVPNGPGKTSKDLISLPASPDSGVSRSASVPAVQENVAAGGEKTSVQVSQTSGNPARSQDDSPTVVQPRSAPSTRSEESSPSSRTASAPNVTPNEIPVSSPRPQAQTPSPPAVDPGTSAARTEALKPAERRASVAAGEPRATNRRASSAAQASTDPATSPPATVTAPGAAAPASSQAVEETAEVAANAPSSPPPAGRVYEINEVDLKPQLVHQVQPTYAPTDPRRRVRGRVRLSGEVWPDGKPHNIQVVKGIGDEALDRSALQAFEQWRFVAGSKSGYPVKTRVIVDMTFQVF